MLNKNEVSIFVAASILRSEVAISVGQFVPIR